MAKEKFQIFKDRAGEFRFNLHSRGNSEIILRSSEGYTTKQGCLTGINSVKRNAPDDSKYYRGTSSNNQYFFSLKAGNGEIIGVSEMYVSTSGRDNGIDAVKRDAPNAEIEDKS